ncbi:MAG: DNA-directed RNA polymerase subunit alpha C-terminal domain-containing protein [Syntrophomonadaceae bacterium]|nr:DNA-directed RNA polymerase subunit alpha C-terminal domain-containing protein [Syntrophomonadaceae bacterium]
MDEHISVLQLSARTQKALAEYGIQTIEELRLFTPQELWQIPGVGRRSLMQIEAALLDYELSRERDGVDGGTAKAHGPQL